MRSKDRNVVERCINKLKQHKAATSCGHRYDKRRRRPHPDLAPRPGYMNQQNALGAVTSQQPCLGHAGSYGGEPPGLHDLREVAFECAILPKPERQSFRRYKARILLSSLAVNV
jgi:hypothetical protein